MPHLLVGALVNARVVSEAVRQLLATTDLNVTVLASGERWQQASEDGEPRFAIEDFLGAGAILSGLPPDRTRSPEARVCEAAFQAVGSDLERVL